jgi:fumarate reductase subunit D
MRARRWVPIIAVAHFAVLRGAMVLWFMLSNEGSRYGSMIAAVLYLLIRIMFFPFELLASKILPEVWWFVPAVVNSLAWALVVYFATSKWKHRREVQRGTAPPNPALQRSGPGFPPAGN